MILKGSIALKIGNGKTLHINQLALPMSIIPGIFYRHAWVEKQGDLNYCFKTEFFEAAKCATPSIDGLSALVTSPAISS